MLVSPDSVLNQKNEVSDTGSARFTHAYQVEIYVRVCIHLLLGSVILCDLLSFYTKYITFHVITKCM